MQYTLRKIPEALDHALRERARTEHKSINQIALEALVRAMGLGESAMRCRDLADLAGTWQEDPDFDRAIADQHRIDDAMWK